MDPTEILIDLQTNYQQSDHLFRFILFSPSQFVEIKLQLKILIK